MTQPLYELALFAGAGGGTLGGKILGWRTVCAVEFDAYARAVLAARQNDGCLDPFPIWNDVRTFTKRNNAVRRVIRELRRIRHSLVISGGFPCQDISCAGKGAGLDGARSGLWAEFARIIREIRPRHVFVENSPMLTSRGLGRVLGDLAAMGYDARWGVLGAVHAGAPHRRLRIWIRAELADADRKQFRKRSRERGDNRKSGAAADRAALRNIASVSREDLADAARDRWPQRDEQHDGRMLTAFPDADSPGREEQRSALADGAEHEAAECGDWWRTEPDVGRVANGVAARVDRLRCIGNGQVPHVAALAWRALSN